MKKAAVIFAEGCEEGEALTIVDVLRRAELHCDMVGLASPEVTGAHDITVRMDRVLDDDLQEYDMVILPGGYGGADAMRNHPGLQAILRRRNEQNQLIAAICAAPIALDAAGVLEGKRFTCYLSTAEKIHSGIHCDDLIVTDGNLTTSQGPATAYAFAYRLAKILGADALSVQKRMAYFSAFDGEEER